MKFISIIIVFFLAGIHAVLAVEPTDPLQREVVDSWSFQSIDEAFAQITRKTGFKVACPEEVTVFYHQLEKQTRDVMHGTGPPSFDCFGGNYDAGKYDSGPKKGLPKTVTIREWMDELCSLSLHTDWKFDPEKRLLQLVVPWKKSDPRSIAELLDYVKKNAWNAKEISDGEIKGWHNAFDALLSKDINYPKAMRVRQRAVYQSLPDDRAYCWPIMGGSKTKYTLVMIHDPSGLRPGTDLVSYYWFKKDGTLAGADMMATGSRISFFDAEVQEAGAPHEGSPSELQVIYKGDGGYAIANYVLEETGLKLIRLINASGRKYPNTARIGESYMPADVR